MKYRKLTSTGDYSFGHGRADFYIDQPEAVAQSCRTRLGLGLEEWFLDKTAGTPWKTRVLGNRTADTRDAAVRARILGTTGVTSISEYNSDVDRETRAFTVNATLETTYGQATVTGTV